ncbi:MAG: protein kinase domain-containing protein, partial [bacterium]
MNIAEELESNISATSLDKVSQGRRTILRKVLGKNFEDKENLISKEQDLCEDLPEGTRKLFEEYSNREKFKQELTREEFEKILSGKLRYLGEGQFGVVYESEDGKYALKFPRNGESISDDRLKNEALKKNTGAFDPKQAYYQQKDEFIARYVGTFKTREGIEVVVFEKIDGEEFQKCVVENPASLFRLLAQAATAIAIFNEAGCINSDIKPNNMMVTNDLYLLKLIDQGSAINLLQKKEKTSTPLSKLPLESTTPLKRFNPENDKPSSTRLSESIFVPATPLYRPPLGSATPLKGLPRGPVTPLVKFKSKESPAVPFEPSTPLASFNPGSDESPSTRLSESLFIPTTPLA